jgi:hypothetical protein
VMKSDKSADEPDTPPTVAGESIRSVK